jgi:molybdate transport system ATP-binding protein
MAGIAARFSLDRPGFSLDVDLRLPSRGVTALFGHSGSGKTTLLRCTAGLERAPQGRLAVDDEVWQDAGRWVPTHKRPIGYVFQEASLFAHLSVLGNLRYGLKRNRDAPSQALDQAIELLGLNPLLDRKPDHLSGGERQRVAIARALAVGPRLLLMDEPLAALDLPRRREILPYLERLHRELALPVLYVTHAPDEVARLADHLVVLEAGRVVAAGPLAEMLTRVDGPIRVGEEAAAILEGRVAERDERWHLARVEMAGSGGAALWTRDEGLPVGAAVRLRVLARDVSLTAQPAPSSIQNVLLGEVEAFGDDEHPALQRVRLRVGECCLLARLTRKAVAELHLVPGQPIWLQIKSAALVD